MKTYTAENGIRYTIQIRSLSLSELAEAARHIVPDRNLWTSAQKRRAMRHNLDTPAERSQK